MCLEEEETGLPVQWGPSWNMSGGSLFTKFNKFKYVKGVRVKKGARLWLCREDAGPGSCTGEGRVSSKIDDANFVIVLKMPVRYAVFIVFLWTSSYKVFLECQFVMQFHIR